MFRFRPFRFVRSFSANANSNGNLPKGLSLSNPSLFRPCAFVHGAFVPASSSGRTIPVVNPSTGAIICNIPHLDSAEVEFAIQSAHRAFPQWSRTSPKVRSDIVRKIFELMMANEGDLSKILTLENGKPLSEAVGEVQYAASYFDFFASEALRMFGDIVPSPSVSTRVVVIRQPIGVVGAITPWNFPSAMIARKMGAALAAGCTMVLKSAESTPLSATAIAAICHQAGLPPGVLNIVNGDPAEIGSKLTSSPLIRKITFTGSTRVGKLLMSQSAGTMKRISMELGGNAPFIVFDDANIDKAIEGALFSKFRNAGQTCIATNRMFVHSKIHGEFCRRLSERVKNLIVGDGFKKGTMIGPLINSTGLRKVESIMKDAVGKGGRILVGGKKVDGPNDSNFANVPQNHSGWYFEPSVVTDCDSRMLAFTEETFGPVSFIFKFDTEEEVIRMANDTNAGLAAYVFTNNSGRTWRMLEGLEYGMVGINQGSVSGAHAPFGGMKESGQGREGSHLGLHDYTEVKTGHFNIAE